MKAKKSLGQNFLVNSRYINAIVKEQTKREIIALEIGPGRGALTGQLLFKTKKLITCEIDKELIAFLEEKFDNQNLELLQINFLDFDMHKLKEKVNVYGNIPYNITSPILLKLLKNNVKFYHAIIMMQLEVGERLLAKEGDKNYSKLSVLMQWFFDVKEISFVPRKAFKPIPKVDSIIIKLIPKLAYDESWDDFIDFIKTAFQFRRKTLWNNVKELITREQFEKFISNKNFDALVRPQELTAQDLFILFGEHRL